MSEAARRIPRLLRPDWGDLLVVFLLAAVGLGAARLFGDSDPATHTATGLWILDHGAVPRVDPFPTSVEGQPWFAYEWLADVGMALVHRVSGWSGIAALSALLIALAHRVLYRGMVAAGRPGFVAFFAALAAAVVGSSHWLARPHLFTVLLLAVWATLLEAVVDRRRSVRWLVMLVPLTALWANLHGGFLAAPGFVAAYAAGAWIDERVVAPTGRRSVAPALALAAVACAFASVANPWGWRMPAHLLRFALTPRPELAAIEEWAPADPGDRAGATLVGFAVLCLAALAVGVIGRRNTRQGTGPRPWHPASLIACAIALLLAFASIRHVALAGTFGALVIARSLGAWLPSAQDARVEPRGGALAALAALAVVIAGWTGRLPGAGYDPALFPVREVAALRAANAGEGTGTVFAPGHWGGYLLLHWPEARVFVDGRWDLYGDRFTREYQALWAGGADAPARLAALGIEWALLPPDAPLVARLDGAADWSREGRGAAAVIFRRRAPPVR